LDVNDDGIIEMMDFYELSNAFGAEGTPMTKAGILFDSGWINVSDKAGQYFDVVHNLNSADVIVDVTGKTTADGAVHQRNIGGTDFVAGWNKTYGGANHDGVWGRGLIQTADGGYAMAGYTNSFGAGGSDVWLVKTDASGNMQWNKTYGGTNDDPYAVSLVQTDDGGYAIGTSTSSFGVGGRDFWLVRIDAFGTPLWNQTYGAAGDEYFLSMIQTREGGFALVGCTRSFSGGDNGYLVVTDSVGTSLWSKVYGGSNTDWLYDVVQTGDGYAMAGNTYSFGAGDTDAWLLKVDSVGNIQWNKTYGTAGGEAAYSLTQTFDGGYAMAGGQNYGWWLLKADAVGNMQWNHAWGTAGGTESANCVIQDSDGGYTLVGQTSAPSNMRLIKTDGSGNDIWNKDYGGTGFDWGSCVIRTADGGYAIAGGTDSFGAGGEDFFLIKTDAAGNALDGFKYGLAWVDSTANSITLYRGTDDAYWNYVRVRIWKVRESP
jgi:predicted secreted protein